MEAPRIRSLAAVAALAGVIGCGGGGQTTQVEDPVATTITITPEVVAFSYLTESRALSARIRDQNDKPFSAALTWSTSDAGVVSITTDGLARAESNGSATITVTAAGLTASLEIPVQQVPRVIRVESGDEQDAIAGEPLPDSIVVQLTDLGGAPVEGVDVAFTPDPTSGTVSETTITTAADGVARTEWTLGADFGCQLLTVTALDVAAEVAAYAGSGVPAPDLVLRTATGRTIAGRQCGIGTPGLARVDLTTLDSVIVTGTVTNQGDIGTLGGFSAALMLADLVIATQSLGPLASGAEAAVELRAGPLQSGSTELTVILDSSDDVAELVETNNTATRAVEVLVQTPLAPGGSITGLSAPVGGELLFVIEVPPGAPDALTIEVTDASPGAADDLDMFVAEGRRPSFREFYPDCISAGPTTEERCQIVFPEGTYHVLLYAWEDDSGQFNPTGFSNVTLTATLGNTIIPFDIDLVFVDRGTAAQDQAFVDAAARWERIIRGDIPDQDFTQFSVDPNACFQGQPAVDDVIDDVRIFVNIRTIDQVGGTLAQAGPCVTRGISALPAFGVMTVDEADLNLLEADGDLLPVILHEMGHVLGIGTIWDDKDLLRNPSLPSNQGTDTHFRGDGAIEAFDAAGGSGYTGAKVPVENELGPGSADAHWREANFDKELMTPLLESGQFKPLSAITIRSMEDLGYGVDVTQADAYSLPAFPILPLAEGLEGHRVIDLGDDVRRGPVAVVDTKGRIVEIRR